jgi:hypothetical protein
MDLERWEKITSASEDALDLSNEDLLLREAWVGMAQSLSSASKAWPLDPEDVFAEIVRRERRQRRSYWFRAAAVAASLLVMVGAVFSVVRNTDAPVDGRRAQVAGPLKWGEAPVWDDGWESSAFEVESEVLAMSEFLRPPPNEAWIDRQIQVLFDECLRVWEML